MVRHSQLDSDIFDSTSPNSSSPQPQLSPQQASPGYITAPAGKPGPGPTRGGLPTGRSPVYRKLSTLADADIAPHEVPEEAPDELPVSPGDDAAPIQQQHSRQWQSKSNASNRVAEVSQLPLC